MRETLLELPRRLLLGLFCQAQHKGSLEVGKGRDDCVWFTGNLGHLKCMGKELLGTFLRCAGIMMWRV